MRGIIMLLCINMAGMASPVLAQPGADDASAWVRFDARRDTGADAQGLADRTTGRTLRPDDPVRIASISKLAVAMAVMRLVERDVLDLDRDVSAVLGWRLRNPAYPEAPITLRQLLSHTAGVRDGIDYGLPLDADLERTMQDGAAWDGRYAPGHYFTYSNLNFPIVAAVMEAATGERFDRIMQRELFGPLRIDACFNWTTCTQRAIRRAVVLYRPDGSVARDDLRGAMPPCPVVPAQDGGCDLASYRLGRQGAAFSPQGGMRISARGLARLGRVLAGRHAGFLKAESLAEMVRPQWRYDGTNGDTEQGLHCAYGLAVMILAMPGRPAACRDDPFGDGRLRIGHSGEAYSLRSGLWVDPVTGKGVAFYATALPADTPNGRSAFRAVSEAMIAKAR
ncbi:serine hydrolase domain-containing protein [Sphingobium algorifonticola]|uniref:Class A beta-lactamase-related serine hydrolase n=1 Tax=Sphingobium algorifonticola TaxID=2008318 RepID=A0A437J8G6_9SPHN|nr:serine hydrolase domain-containing protein [Sphingobium algorifonticola]RVT41788.1 class A beta-lactamase-related serine hydrolase [Sphingobium algorifonticola]